MQSRSMVARDQDVCANSINLHPWGLQTSSFCLSQEFWPSLFKFEFLDKGRKLIDTSGVAALNCEKLREPVKNYLGVVHILRNHG